MQDLEKNIDQLKFSLNEALSLLKNINNDNFKFNLVKAKEMMENAQNLKIKLKNEYISEQLNIFDADLLKTAKLISVEFDNINTRKRLEYEIVSKKLIMIQNQKKLLNYSR